MSDYSDHKNFDHATFLLNQLSDNNLSQLSVAQSQSNCRAEVKVAHLGRKKEKYCIFLYAFVCIVCLCLTTYFYLRRKKSGAQEGYFRKQAEGPNIRMFETCVSDHTKGNRANVRPKQLESNSIKNTNEIIRITCTY